MCAWPSRAACLCTRAWSRYPDAARGETPATGLGYASSVRLLVNNWAELPTELLQAPAAVRAYVHQQLRELLAHSAFAAALSWTIPYGADYTYQQLVHQCLRELATESA